MLKIVQLGYKTLTQKALEVKDFKDPEVHNLVREMKDTLLKNPDTSVGLAANQVGVLKRITIIRRIDLETKEENKGQLIFETVINPKYIKKSEAKSTYWEGCLSIRNGDLFGRVTRPSRIEIEYQDLTGEKKTLKASGFFATLIQHEIDHLDGILFTKYVPDPSLLYTKEELDKMRK